MYKNSFDSSLHLSIISFSYLFSSYFYIFIPFYFMFFPFLNLFSFHSLPCFIPFLLNSCTLAITLLFFSFFFYFIKWKVFLHSLLVYHQEEIIFFLHVLKFLNFRSIKFKTSSLLYTVVCYCINPSFLFI